MASPPTNSLFRLDGKKVADEMALELRKRAEILIKEHGITPQLDIFTNEGEDNVYVRNKAKRGAEIGIQVNCIPIKDDVLTLYKEISNPFIIQLPCPNITKEEINYVLSTFTKLDMDGLNDVNLGKMVLGEDYIPPCTPSGIISLLDYYHIPIEGKNVTIIGRGLLVGKPLSIMMTERNARVTLCHSKMPNTSVLNSLMQADIIISAVGKYNYLSDWTPLHKNQVLVDVGINRVNGKLCGDFSPTTIWYGGYYTPSPGGIGPMTIISLMKIVIDFYERGVN